ncbi:MAG: hybrid sensor histidine kinase/response regulator, partial [Bacteroidaceae bacterium]|nr:hybrid sensor histidine kinase/response regulator [Bacteroidaceae bacterium]
MWFLTYAGIDKFDGKNIKHYPLSSGKGYIDSYSENNTLKTDSRGRPWFITPEGETFVYCQLMDEFQLIELPLEMSNQTFDLVELTSYDEIWYCNRKNIYIYTINTGETKHIELEHEHSRITSVLQISENNYIIGTNETICQAEIQNNILKPKQVITDSFFSPNLLFYHPKYKILFAGSDSHGMLVYDLNLDYIIQTYTNLKDTPISAINYYGDAEILISTQGNGIYRYHLKDHTLESFLRADYSEDNLMLGNNIRTIYTDEEERIWMSVYPIGVSVYDRRYPKYKWTRHQNGNIHSLGDDQVNHILEDSEGDIWYATNDGISLYYKKTKTWHHFFSEKEYTDNPKNSTFLSLCEIRPGYIVAGGHMSGVYGIDKHSLKHEFLTSYSINSKQSPQIQNKYIRSIYKDKNGYVWTGGHYYLGCSNRAINFFEHYPIDHPITCIIEKDSVNLFIGTGYGIYLFDRSKKKLTKLRVPFASQFITTLYKHTNDVLYIGTTSSGLVALYPDGKYEIYSYRNSSLISDNVYSIIPYGEDRLIISTEKSLAKFNTKEKKFSNWTVDRGLIETSFNPRAGIHTSEN